MTMPTLQFVDSTSTNNNLSSIILPTEYMKHFYALSKAKGSIIWIDTVMKTNKVGRQQVRVCFITKSHFYSCLSNGTVKRCLPIHKITHIHRFIDEYQINPTISQRMIHQYGSFKSPDSLYNVEIAFICPSEYDIKFLLSEESSEILISKLIEQSPDTLTSAQDINNNNNNPNYHPNNANVNVNQGNASTVSSTDSIFYGVFSLNGYNNYKKSKIEVFEHKMPLSQISSIVLRLEKPSGYVKTQTAPLVTKFKRIIAYDMDEYDLDKDDDLIEQLEPGKGRKSLGKDRNKRTQSQHEKDHIIGKGLWRRSSSVGGELEDCLLRGDNLKENVNRQRMLSQTLEIPGVPKKPYNYKIPLAQYNSNMNEKYLAKFGEYNKELINIDDSIINSFEDDFCDSDEDTTISSDSVANSSEAPQDQSSTSQKEITAQSNVSENAKEVRREEPEDLGDSLRWVLLLKTRKEQAESLRRILFILEKKVDKLTLENISLRKNLSSSSIKEALERFKLDKRKYVDDESKNEVIQDQKEKINQSNELFENNVKEKQDCKIENFKEEMISDKENDKNEINESMRNDEKTTNLKPINTNETSLKENKIKIEIDEESL